MEVVKKILQLAGAVTVWFIFLDFVFLLFMILVLYWLATGVRV